MKIEIENVDIHIRLLVEHRIYEDKKKKIHKTEEDIMTSKSFVSVTP
jgi:hypothetical protein